MWNRQEMMSRIRECQTSGSAHHELRMVIAMAQGILERALEPFPEALAAFHEARQEQLEAVGVRQLRPGSSEHAVW
jgi:hypothetical protein